MDDRRRRLATTWRPRGVPVSPVEGDRRRVVVQLRQGDVELADDLDHDLGDETRPIAVEEPVEHPPHPVVVERPEIANLQPEQRGLVGGGPLAHRIEGLWLQMMLRTVSSITRAGARRSRASSWGR